MRPEVKRVVSRVISPFLHPVSAKRANIPSQLFQVLCIQDHLRQVIFLSSDHSPDPFEFPKRLTPLSRIELPGNKVQEQLVIFLPIIKADALITTAVTE